MTEPLILDTSAWLLALSGEAAYAEALESATAVHVPGLVLAELDYHLRNKREAMKRVLEDLGIGAYVYEPPSAADLVRALEIDRKFSGLRLGLVDATIAALAERTAMLRVLTADSDFVAVRVGPRWDKPLHLVVPPPPPRGTAKRLRR